jgi:hypothetical protein
MVSKLIHESTIGLVLSHFTSPEEPPQLIAFTGVRPLQHDGGLVEDEKDSMAASDTSQPTKFSSSERSSDDLRTDSFADQAHRWSVTKRVIVAGVICTYT